MQVVWDPLGQLGSRCVILLVSLACGQMDLWSMLTWCFVVEQGAAGADGAPGARGQSVSLVSISVRNLPSDQQI